MDNARKIYIKNIFDDFKKTKGAGIYMSGTMGEGEFKLWHPNDQLWLHFWDKENRHEGEYKFWKKDGETYDHRWYENGESMQFPKDVKIKEGYLLGGDGKYYKD